MKKSQTDSQADISRDEILFRLYAVSDSLHTYYYLKNHKFCECEDCLNQDDFFNDLRSRLEETTLQHSLVQFSALFDNSGKYSFEINNGSIRRKRIETLFPELDSEKITYITKSLKKIINDQKYKELISEAIRIRGNYVAHMGSRRSENIDDWDEVINYHELTIPKNFYIGNLIKICSEIRNVLLNL